MDSLGIRPSSRLYVCFANSQLTDGQFAHYENSTSGSSSRPPALALGTAGEDVAKPLPFRSRGESWGV